MATATTGVFDLDRNFAILDRQWAAMLALCDDAAAYHAKAEKVSAWGIDQHVNHMGIAMGRIAGGIEGMLANPQQGAGVVPTHPFAIPLLEGGTIPRGAGKAPDILLPPNAPAASDTRALLQSSQARWNALSKQQDRIKNCPATFPHFVLGNYTSTQWVRFITVHTAHHLKIIRDILNATEQSVPYDDAAENIN